MKKKNLKLFFNLLFFSVGLLLSQLLSQNADAVVTGISVPSYFSQTTVGTTVTIYVGRADPNATSPTSGTVPYDTCALITTYPTTATACNKNSIYPNLIFEVTFSSDATAAFASGTKVVMVSGTTKIDGTITSGTPTVNQPIKATFLWGNICNLAGHGTDCDTSFTQSVQIGLSKDGTYTMQDNFTLQINFRAITSTSTLAFHTDCSDTQAAAANEGVCGFAIKPGDGKVIFGNVLIPTSESGSTQDSWPSPGTDAGGVSFAGVKIYYREVVSGAVEPVTDSTEYLLIAPAAAGTFEADLPIDADGNMSKTRITGLNNESLYVFSIATYDQAGNVTNFSDLTAGGTFYSVTGPHYGRPGEVVGLLSDRKCFIATAAFGSDMAPQVELLRQFRNEFLLKNHFGEYFVKIYYQLSPPVAEYIARHENLRAMVRWTLSPVIGWAQFCLEFGFIPGLFLLLALGFLAREIWQRFQILVLQRLK